VAGLMGCMRAVGLHIGRFDGIYEASA